MTNTQNVGMPWEQTTLGSGYDEESPYVKRRRFVPKLLYLFTFWPLKLLVPWTINSKDKELLLPI
jgi:hypothetical protein